MELRKYLSGGLPPGVILNLNIGFIRHQIESTKYDGDQILELLLIGLMGYTESFYKNFFAGSINMFPFLLHYLSQKRLEIKIPLEDLLRSFIYYGMNLTDYFGDFTSDKFKFDKATDINKSYSLLINYEPFSGEEIIKYQAIKDKRNLFAHNGGLMNSARSQVSRNLIQREYKNQTFLSLGKWELQEYILFIEETSKKFLNISKDKLTNLAQQEINSGQFNTSEWEAKLDRLTLWEPQKWSAE